MTDSTSQKAPVLFWIISVIAIIWNAMGVNQYLQQAYLTDAFKASMPSKEALEMAINTPSWAMAAFAIAVFFGLLGSIALILRKRWASPLYLISLIGIIIHMIHNVFISDSVELMGAVAIIFPIMIIVIGVFLYFYSKRALANGWIS